MGYSLAHAYGAAFDNHDLIVACIVGDGEAETGALAASWHSNKFLNPARDGAVLPILHLNGYKIANPTLLARIPESELRRLFEGYGYAPHFVTGDDPMTVLPSTVSGPVQPLGVRSTIIGHAGRAVTPWTRASAWMRAMSATTASSVSASSRWTVIGSSPVTKCGA